MSEVTLTDVQNDLAALRQELDGLRAQMAASAPAAKDLMNAASDAMQCNLKQSLAEKDRTSGLSIGCLIAQVRGSGGSGASFNIVTLNELADLPTDVQITEKIARLTAFVRTPLLLRALRALTEPHFEDKDKRRTKADLAAALGATETEVEAALTPMLERYGVRWGKDASGQEYYEWSGDTFAMTLLVLG